MLMLRLSFDDVKFVINSLFVEEKPRPQSPGVRTCTHRFAQLRDQVAHRLLSGVPLAVRNNSDPSCDAAVDGDGIG